MNVKYLFTLLLISFLASVPIASAQEVSSVPIETGNTTVQKATGAAFTEGWNFFTLGFGDCTPRIVLNEIQADGGSALKVETLFIKELLGWQPYSILNLDSEKKKIGGGDTLAFNSNQKFYFNMDQKTCSNPDKERQAQIDRIGQANTSNSPFIEKVKELPIDMWTKLMDLLNQKNEPKALQSDVQAKQVFDSLTVVGKTTVNDIGITGKIQNSLLSINGLDEALNAVTINTLGGDLFFQNNSLGGVNFLSGKVKIDTSGNLTSQKINIDESNAGGSAIGGGVIFAKQTSVTIFTTAVTGSSRIFVTPVSDTDKPLVVKNLVSGKSFNVTIIAPYSSDIKFNWWIVN